MKICLLKVLQEVISGSLQMHHTEFRTIPATEQVGADRRFKLAEWVDRVGQRNPKNRATYLPAATLSQTLRTGGQGPACNAEMPG